MGVLRYGIACLSVLVGLLTVFVGLVIGYGLQEHGDVAVALPFAIVGLVICLSAYGLVRPYPEEKKVRQALNVFLFWGSLTLAGAAFQLGVRKFAHVDPTEALVASETISYPFFLVFGGLCLVASYVLNVLLKPGRSQTK